MKEAIIFVPGNNSKERGNSLGMLVADLKDSSSLGTIDITEETEVTGFPSNRLTVTYDREDKETSTVDIYEAFWGDLRQNMNEMPMRKKAWHGLLIFMYWTFSKIWRIGRGNITKTVFLVLSVTALFMWYVSILIASLELIVEMDFFGTVIESEGQTIVIASKYAQLINHYIGSSDFWIILSLVLGLFPLMQLANTSYNVKQYLQRAGYRNQARKRVAEVASLVMKNENYDKITILGHSFGSMIATHFIADTQLDFGKAKVRFVTLGASMSFLKLRSTWVTETIQECAEQPGLDLWEDYFSNEDWLCSVADVTQEAEAYTTNDVGEAKFVSVPLSFGTSWRRRLNVSQVHLMYTKQTNVANNILDW